MDRYSQTISVVASCDVQLDPEQRHRMKATDISVIPPFDDNRTGTATKIP
jgi:hypothetical protein